MKIKGKKFSIFVGTAMAVIITVALLLGGCPATDSATDPGNNGNTTATYPGAPIIVSLTPEDGQVMVAWTAPSDNGGAAITGYFIYYSETQGSGKKGTKVDAGNVTGFAVSALTNGTEYYFVVTATNSAGEGAISSEASAIPSDTVSYPGTPTGVTLTQGNGLITVTWTAPTNNGGAPISGYFIYYSETQGNGTSGTKVDAGNVTEFDVTGLTNGTTYYFVVTAANSVGESEASGEENAVPATVPDAPTGVILTPGNQQVAVVWTSPANNGGAVITGYYIYYSETQGSGTNGTKVDAGVVTKFVVNGLTNGTTYFFVVTAANSVGESILSEEQTTAPTATVPGAPTIVSLTPGDGQVTISWTAPANDGGVAITGYSIYYSETQETGTSGTKLDAGNVTESVVSSLTNGTEYFFVVTATNSVGEGTASDEERVTPSATATVPDAPTGLKLTPGDEQLTVAWTPPTNNGGEPITGYYIYYSETQGSGTGGTQIDAGDTTEYTVSGLTNGLRYYFVVTAVNSVGESVASDEESTIPATVPDAPTIVSLTPRNKQVTVAWTAPTFNGGADISDYSIYYSENSGDGINGIKVDAGNVLEYVVSGLTNSITYYFVVTALNSVGESVASDEQNTVPLATVPGAPTGVTLTKRYKKMKVAWTAPVDDGGAPITGYKIYYSLTQGTGKGGSLVDVGNVTEFIVSELLNARVYYFVVTAVNSVGESAPSSEQQAAPDSSVPEAPTIVSLIPGVGEVAVTWKAPEYNGGLNITGYNIYYSEIQGSGKSGTKVNAGNGTSFLVTGLTNGTTYYFVVTAVNGIGEGAASGEQYATPATTVPDAPTGVTLTPGNGQVRVAWTAPANDGGTAITGYSIYYSETQGFGTNSKKVDAGNVTDYLVSGLTNGTTYYFIVTAINAVGESIASVEKNAIPATVPGKPVNVTAVVSKVGEITVSWNNPTDNGGSEITEYRVYWATSAGFTQDLTNSRNTTDGTVSELVIQNLNPGTPYYFVVTARNRAGEGVASDEVSAIAAYVPEPPTGVSALGTGDGEITVSWMAPGNNGGLDIKEYRVYWGSASGFTPITTNSEILVLPATPLELIIQNLNENINYFFVVTAKNSKGESAISTEVSTTGFSVPGPPVNVSAIVTGVGRITVSWSAPTIDGGADIMYTVYWDTTPGVDIASPMDSKIINDPGITEAVIDGLTIDIPYYFVITATNLRGEGPASEEKSVTPTAQLSSLISTLTLTIDGKEYSVTFSNSITSVDIDSMATLATVKAVTLVSGASDLEINDELIIKKGVTTIPITAGDGSTREHIIYFRNPQLTISASQLKILDGTKTDGTKKFPSQFMVFDITTTATVSSQYNVEFLLVKDGSTAPNTLEKFRKTISMPYVHSENPIADADISMSHKSALFPGETTSLYLAHDSEGNYPLETGTRYKLYVVQPQSTDTAPYSLGEFTTGTIVDMGDTTQDAFIESLNTANIGGKLYMTNDQFVVFYCLYGDDFPGENQFILPNWNYLMINENFYGGYEENWLHYWIHYKKSSPKPCWWVVAIQHKQSLFEYMESGELKYITNPLYVFTTGYAEYRLTFHLIE